MALVALVYVISAVLQVYLFVPVGFLGSESSIPSPVTTQMPAAAWPVMSVPNFESALAPLMVVVWTTLVSLVVLTLLTVNSVVCKTSAAS